ncbi:MAG TPA: hypothetical protein VLK32_07965 [Bacillota bacterium]|nr:hypothetical protein [Bacillota bacterium]
MRGILLGLEEEVFLTQPDEPSLESLYYLARLLWTDPRFYFVHTDSNFARGEDVLRGVMGGVEVSTHPCSSPAELVADLAARRRALAAACGDQALLVAIGHLVQGETATRTCGLHLHLGGLPDPHRSYRRLARFLPLLALLTASTPYSEGSRWGTSYRLAHSYALGSLRADPYYRFQDLILARRLGTLEARLFDPTWDLRRIETLIECVLAVAMRGPDRELNLDEYARLRHQAAACGYTRELAARYRELADIHPVDEELFAVPPAETIVTLVRRHGVTGAYSALDNAYRGGSLVPDRLPRYRVRPDRVVAGLLGYYLPRLPYKARKAWQEW